MNFSFCVISIHAPREGGDHQKLDGDEFDYKISIHAPREGGDDKILALTGDIEISIHAPREGGDCVSIVIWRR